MISVGQFVSLALIGIAIPLTQTLTLIEMTGMVTRCASGQNFTEAAIPGLLNAQYSDDQATKCFLRCLGHELKIYDDANGVNMHDVWILLRQGRKDEEEKEFAESHAKCVKENLSKVAADDYCGRTYATYICFADDWIPLVKELVGVPSIGSVFGI
ncbi:general odorant-binding protein 99b-like [Toxorhynchites rutilus septentrionalis]|uniref:general odorant-binding protein 99b-like n=1 Tax=Toxorhynchites rutilus septentrionalis TaxID=329112 RepID=UPI00247938FA|nr:general odorant-binding protein 99b-like [Toxorhynchites rutilus septentrionalis]